MRQHSIVDGIIKAGISIGIIAFAMGVGAQAYQAKLMIEGKLEREVRYYQPEVIENYYIPVNVTVAAEQEAKIEETAPDLEEEAYYDSLELLALCVEAEAGNQGLIGKRMVASVILNRVEDGDWPNTIEEVITQPYQFSTYWDGAMERANPNEETFEACKQELEERGWPGIYYFTSGHYSEYGTPWKQVGDHYFSRK